MAPPDQGEQVHLDTRAGAARRRDHRGRPRWPRRRAPPRPTGSSCSRPSAPGRLAAGPLSLLRFSHDYDYATILKVPGPSTTNIGAMLTRAREKLKAGSSAGGAARSQWRRYRCTLIGHRSRVELSSVPCSMPRRGRDPVWAEARQHVASRPSAPTGTALADARPGGRGPARPRWGRARGSDRRWSAAGRKPAGRMGRLRQQSRRESASSERVATRG